MMFQYSEDSAGTYQETMAEGSTGIQTPNLTKPASDSLMIPGKEKQENICTPGQPSKDVS
jgi:hypothetical protein